MKLKTTLLAAATTLAIAPAAYAGDGIYGAIGAGINYMHPDNDVSNDSVGGAAPYTFDSEADYNNGIGIYVALGKHIGNGFRAELEGSYRNNDIRHIAVKGPVYSGFPPSTISGDTKTYGVMANLIYDFEGLSDFVTPYLGAGAGVAFIDHDIVGNNTAAGAVPASPLTIAYAADKAAFAYQGIAGLAFDLADDLILDISYRYFAVDKPTVAATLNGVAAGIKTEYETHSLFAGLRWSFGGAAAPAVQYKDCWDGSSVPMSAECPPQLIEDQSADLDPLALTVYFDYDKSNLTPQAQTLISQAAAQALQNDIDTVVVSGNTDTSGSSAYNQALSERRAAVVRDALIANGIPAGNIRTEAYGETNLATPTADGVREPLNRRSEVVISFE